MKIDHVELMIVAIVLSVIGLAVGLVALAATIAKTYGLTAGMLCVLLPIAAATAALVYLLIRENKGSSQISVKWAASPSQMARPVCVPVSIPIYIIAHPCFLLSAGRQERRLLRLLAAARRAYQR